MNLINSTPLTPRIKTKGFKIFSGFLLVCILLLFAPSKVNAQTPRSLGNGPLSVSETVTSLAVGDSLWRISKDSIGFIEGNYWNGSTWSALPNLNVMLSPFSQFVLETHNGALYLSGEFLSSPGPFSYKSTIYRLRKGAPQWESVFTFDSATTNGTGVLRYPMASYKGTLYIGARKRSASSWTSDTCLIAFKNGIWNWISPSTIAEKRTGLRSPISSLQVYNDTLYLGSGGGTLLINNSISSTVARFNGNTFLPFYNYDISRGFLQAISAFSVSKDGLIGTIISDKLDVTYFDYSKRTLAFGKSRYTITKGYSNQLKEKVLKFKNKYFLYIEDNTLLGDGFPILVQSSGLNPTWVPYNSVAYSFYPWDGALQTIWVVNNRLTVLATMYRLDLLGYDLPPEIKYVSTYINEGKAAKGTLFYDLDTDGLLDSIEPILENKLIIAKDKDQTFAFTNENGAYKISLDSGQSTLAPHTNALHRYSYYTTPRSGKYYLNVQGDTTYQNLDFGITRKLNITDYSIRLTNPRGFRIRLGDTAQILVNLTNEGTTNNQKTATKVTLPKGTYFVATTSGKATEDKGVVTWSSQNPIVLGGTLDTLFVGVDTSLTLGDTLHFYSSADSGIVSLDSFITDNYDTLSTVVVSSYDPNDKQCWPSGPAPAHTKEVRYQIRFQNTGTDYARRVIIVDTMDPALPIDRISLTEHSHKYRIEVHGKSLQFIHDNINLPDSIADEPNSHGFLSYRCTLADGIPAGTIINNTAYIYFDYNTPIVTNTAQVTLVKRSSILEISTPTLKVWPNPAKDYIYLQSTNTDLSPGTVEVIDLSGRVHLLLTAPLLGVAMKIPVEHLAPGTYIIRTQNSGSAKILVASE